MYACCLSLWLYDDSDLLTMLLIYVKMPTKNVAAKKKSRVEMREELHLALQRQQAPQASQQAPVLPLVLPIPSTHSTTGSTGLAPPTRSIRCSFVTTHVPTEPGKVLS